ncbi:MAG: DegT/DnrJ/EryC1/StrS aminotransferase family protein [Spirochaetota bacterium]
MKTIRKNFLPFALPSISEKAIQEVVAVLRSGWITSGPKVQEFETAFANYVGAEQAVALNSATAGLHLCLDAIGLTDKDAIITTAVTFTATAEVACYFGALPVLLDVDPVNHIMTPEILLNLITKDCIWDGKQLCHKASGRVIKAVMPVHLAGYTCDMQAILKIARKYNLFVIEDAAHAFPAVHAGKMIGSWGDFTVFSFYATKGITTGEGGMVTTNHSEYAARIRCMRLHGIDKTAYKRTGWYYEVVEAGYKYNLTDIAAAIGLIQLEEAKQLWDRRTEIAQRYLQAFAGIPGLLLPKEDKAGIHSWHLFRIEVDAEQSKKTRDEFAEELKARNIGTSLHFIPLYEHPYYQKKFTLSPQDFPNSSLMYSRSLSLPLFPRMTDQDVLDVVEAVRDILL